MLGQFQQVVQFAGFGRGYEVELEVEFAGGDAHGLDASSFLEVGLGGELVLVDALLAWVGGGVPRKRAKR